MKFPCGRGQGALEYIQTYAWAILVVLIVGVVLWQLGVFGPHSGVNTATGFSKIKVLEPSIIYRAGTTDALDFTAVNGAGIRMREVRSAATSGDCQRVWIGTSYTNTELTTEEDCNEKIFCYWDAGGSDCFCERYTYLNPGDTISPVSIFCNSLDSGEQFVVHLLFEYQERVGKDYVTHQDEGTLRGTVE
ncbi:MAG: hypothetical protein KKB24_00520 [Candidatus Altiarchaeota archaeon]|nr:hypothetical protein [Candidatus Altiarchaeota archaeon]